MGLIISDWNMPEMNGYEFLLKVRASKKYMDIPFIMATAQGEKEQAQKAIAGGADHFITKPFTSSDLGEVIDTAGYEACEFVLGAENIFAGFPVDVEVFESDDPAMPGGGTLVDDAHLLGSLSGLVLEDPLIRAGYIGKKQYIQLRITVPGGLAGGLWGICVLMNAWHQPTPEQ